MPCTKNNFCQLNEWRTLKQLNNNGFMPTGKPFNLAPTGYSLTSIDYYSPYEIRPMTDKEIESYNENRKMKVKSPKKPFGTLLYRLKEYYSSINVNQTQKYGNIIIKQKIIPFSRRCHGGNEIVVNFFNKNSECIYECNLTTICTRITRGVYPYIFFDFYDPNITIEDAKCIKSIIDVNETTNRAALIKIKQILANTESFGMELIDEEFKYKFKYIDFTDLI